MRPITLSVGELRANLGRALRAVGKGKEIIIMSRNRPVARITRLAQDLRGETAVDRKLKRLAAQGKIRQGLGGKPVSYKSIQAGGVVEQLLADRR